MDKIFEPSILAVCVVGCAESDDAPALSELIAARAKAAMPRRDVPALLGESAKCDACDDSACGMEVDVDSSAGEIGRSSCTNNGDFARRADRADAADCLDEFSALGAQVIRAPSGRRALELLRMLRVDLVLVGEELTDMPLRQLVTYIRATRPWQKWAMVGSNISRQDEIEARTLGALGVFDTPVDWKAISAIAAAVAERRAYSSIGQGEREADRVSVRDWATRLGVPMTGQNCRTAIQG